MCGRNTRYIDFYIYAKGVKENIGVFGEGDIGGGRWEVVQLDNKIYSFNGI